MNNPSEVYLEIEKLYLKNETADSIDGFDLAYYDGLKAVLDAFWNKDYFDGPSEQYLRGIEAGLKVYDENWKARNS